jgi:2,5-furandicarboxylate decarboxylase 1
VKGPNRTGVLLPPSHHNAMHFRKYEAQGQAMEIAAYIGHHPIYHLGASSTLPYGVDEYDFVGALLGEPARLIKCETVDLEVPADAEIVLEGRVLPGEREEEGPYAEFQEYYLEGTGKKPVVEWTTITTRRDPIFKFLQNGSEVEGGVLHKIPISANIYNRVVSVGGFVDLKNVAVLPSIFGVVLQLRQRFHGEARRALMAALSSEHGSTKVAIAVDEDVDVNDLADIWWAVNTRVDARDDIIAIPDVRLIMLDPNGRKVPGSSERKGSAMMIDATKPPECDPARADYERARPMGTGQVKLADFLTSSEAERA